MGVWGTNDPHPRATQLSLSQILLGACVQKGRVSRIQGGEAVSCDGEAPVRLGKSWRPLPQSYTTQSFLDPAQISWGAGSWQGGATRNLGDGATRNTRGGASRFLLREGSSQVHRNLWGMIHSPKQHNSFTDTSWICPCLYSLAHAADSSAGCELHMVGWLGVQKFGLLQPPGWCCK